MKAAKKNLLQGAYLQKLKKNYSWHNFFFNWYLQNILKPNYLEYFLRDSKKKTFMKFVSYYVNFLCKDIFKKVLGIRTLVHIEGLAAKKIQDI
jgi:hypothetical protein